MRRFLARRRWLWLCIAALPLIGGVALVNRGPGGWSRPAIEPPTAPASHLMFAASAPTPLERQAAPATAAAETVGNARIAQQAGEAADDSAEICGFGRVPKAELEKPVKEQLLPPAWAVAAEAAQAQRANAARSQLAARLAAGSDVDRVASRMVMGDNEAAAIIAAQSPDAAAYRLGLAGCHYGERPDATTSCRGLDVQGWIQRDPTDARPWFLLASRALQRRDFTAGKEALEEAMRRPKMSAAEPLIAAAMKDAPSAVKDRTDLGLVSIEIMGRQAAMSDWAVVGALSRYCSVEGLKDAQRQPLCQQLSRRMMDGADTLMEALVAQKIADRAGVPADQQKYTAASLAAAQNFFTDESSDAVLGLDCASLGRTGNFFVERAQRGELRIALDWLNRRNQGKAPASSASAVAR